MQRVAITLVMSWMLVGVALASPGDAATPNAAGVPSDVAPQVAQRARRALVPVAPASPQVNVMEVADDLVHEWQRAEG